MNKQELSRDLYMLKGSLSKKGYDWWWHSFTGVSSKTGNEKAFFIEYFIVNPGLGKDEPILGQINKEKPSYVMIKVGFWGEGAKQIHQFHPIKDLHISNEKLDLIVGNCQLSEISMSGQIFLTEEECNAHPEYMSNFGEMSWNLKINKKIAFNVGYGASKFFRKLNAFEMFWHAEGMKTEYEGKVILNGEEYKICPESSYGYADKNWGSDFTSPWVWISSWNLVSKVSGKQLKNSVFNVGGGRPKVLGLSLDRKLLIDFYYEGQDYEFNFSKFWTRTKTKFNCYETEDRIIWKVTSENRNEAIKIEIFCLKKEMLLINYESPNGLKLHNRLWNGGTGEGEVKLYKKSSGKKILIDDIIVKNVGCEYGEYNK